VNDRPFDAELGKYKQLVAEIMDAAEEAFIRNAQKRGKFGWDDPKVWEQVQANPLDRAIKEIGEARQETGHARLKELGDAVNYLVFDHAINAIRREAR